MGKINAIIDKELCISCGLCAIDNIAKMEIDKGIYKPVFKGKLNKGVDEYLYEICPGKGYNILSEGKQLYNFNNDIKYDYRLGNYINFGASYSNDSEFLIRSSSGGLMPSLSFYLLKEKYVDGIVTVKFTYTKKGPIPTPFIAKSKEDLIQSQGSKYMPVPLFEIIDEIKNFNGKLCLIGTPCQIAGIRLLQKKDVKLKEKIKFTIANFCGGFRDYRETERIFKIFDIKRGDISDFSYRGNGQPGCMTIKHSNNRLVQIKYPDYARLTGYTKYYRCRTCVDATGELADISFGDAWINRFLNTDAKWSVHITRNTKLDRIFNEMIEKGLVRFKEVSFEELIQSQRGNLETKKERQNSRLKVLKKLNREVPYFDGGYNQEKLNTSLEIRVIINHKLMLFLEKIGLYLGFARITNRIPNDKYEL